MYTWAVEGKGPDMGRIKVLQGWVGFLVGNSPVYSQLSCRLSKVEELQVGFEPVDGSLS